MNSKKILISVFIVVLSTISVHCAWEWPTDSYSITSDFGPRISPTTNAWDFHEGIDISGNQANVYAAESGIVKRVGGIYNVMEVHHDNGMISRYLHLYQFRVDHDSRVNAGDLIAISGEAGTDEPHLHFDFGYNPGDGPHPLKYLPYNNTTTPTVYSFNIVENKIFNKKEIIEIDTRVLTTTDKDLNQFYLFYQPIGGTLTEIDNVSYDPNENCGSATVTPNNLGDDTFKLNWDMTNLSDGEYYLSVFAYDAKNGAGSKAIKITIDTTPPDILA